MELSVLPPNILQKILLSCGILATLVKVATDVFAGRMWNGYSFTYRSVSELSAIGAPTRSFVLSLDLVSNLLLIAFSVGIWQLAGQNTLMRIVAGLIAGNALISSFVSLFMPMHITQDGDSAASTIHVVLMASGVLLFLLAMGLAGAANHNWVRYYSFGTLLVYLVLTVARLLIPSQNTSGLAVPTVGAQERTMVLGYLLWIVALAIHFLTRSGS